MTLSHRDYTVACICPMGLELAPVKAMLDKSHPYLVSQRDQNSYTLGEIAGHNMVIAVLPEIGLNSAATVATQLLNDFPSIRFGLLVGIGGGIPDEEGDGDDIRLGDVVVSKPTASFSGVVQFDMGKYSTSGGFVRTGMLAKPPHILQASVETLAADHRMKGSRVPQYMSKMLQDYPVMEEKYSYPGAHQDQLFQADYAHAGGRNCSHCDQQRIVSRDDRYNNNPRFHYGTIGSANMLVEDAGLREDLRRALNVICVEMEAAGLMDSFPCLVIRGIGGYADSHKNKKWQPYAAATAAAYMKELLSIIPPKEVAKEPAAINIVQIPSVVNEIREVIDTHFQRQEIRYRNEKLQACHLALKTTSYEMFKNNISNRAPGTCAWVLNHSMFKTWNSRSSNHVLWITADPGCGKSVLSKTLVDEVLGSDGQPRSICYFFFNESAGQVSLSSALCAMLHQLFSKQPSLLIHAEKAYQELKEDLKKEIHELWRILLSAVLDQSAPEVVCVIDALDEATDQDRGLLISKLCNFYQLCRTASSERPKLKFLVTSRPSDSVLQYFSEAIGTARPDFLLQGENLNENIGREIDLVIERKVQQLANEVSLSDDIKRRLLLHLLGMRHRTYLWLCLAIGQIRETYKHSLNQANEVIDHLPESVNDAYEKILARVDVKLRPRVRTILLIIAGAKRPLRPMEIALALGMTDDTIPHKVEDIKVDASQLQRQIREWCGLFVFFNHGKVFLIHQTAKDFLLCQPDTVHSSSQWKWNLPIMQIERTMAMICVRYLSLRNFCLVEPGTPEYRIMQTLIDSGPAIRSNGELDDSAETTLVNLCASEDDGEENETEGRDEEDCNIHKNSIRYLRNDSAGVHMGIDDKDFKWGSLLFRSSVLNFFAYASAFWCHHTDHATLMEADPLWTDIRFLNDRPNHMCDLSWLSLFWNSTYLWHTKPEFLGIIPMIVTQQTTVLDRMDLDMETALNARDEDGRTPLLIAAELGLTRSVKWLINRGADLSVRSESGDDALGAAVISGHLEIARQLLDAGANPNIPVPAEMMLKATNEELFVATSQLVSPLQVACHFGDGIDLEMVRLLLSRGADVNAWGGKDGSSLHAAISGGSTAVVKVLLEAGADPKVRNRDGTALSYAAKGGFEEVVEMLLDAGADADSAVERRRVSLKCTDESRHARFKKLSQTHASRSNRKRKRSCGSSL